MRAAIMQPSYLPWAGYFELMLRSDVFVFLDDVQFERKSWQSRNRIKGPSGPIWLRIPCKHGGQGQPICDVEIDNTQPWQKDHLASIRMAYRRADWADRVSLFEGLYQTHWSHLSDLTTAAIALMAGCLAPAPAVLFSSSMPGLPTGRDERIVAICEQVGATELYDAAGAQSILSEEPFREAGITLRWQRYEHPEYRQLHGPFIPYMSALDAILNEGPQARGIILSGGQW